jgi:ABC-type transport system involved in multi-copper enzyme maturation permease subunit
VSALATGLRRIVGIRPRGGRLGRWLRSFASGVSAVSTKELRGRMRGRRAFVVVTVYLLLLSIFAFGIYSYLRQSAAIGVTGDPVFGRPGGMPIPGYGDAGLSAAIGHALFSGLLMLETLLVLVLAPAFTSGAISLEREKQTIDLLVTTPLSTLGMVVGKLLSALTYVFLLIIASIPLASLVFVFGGVGPEDLVRGYVFLFALAFGMGALGLLISALVKRTQTATVITYVMVLALTLGSVGVHQFLVVATQSTPTGGVIIAQQRHKAPEALLWLNPFVANLDMVCTTAPGSYHFSCAYMSTVTGRPYFGSQFGGAGTTWDMPTDGPERMPIPPGGPVVDLPAGPGFGDQPDPPPIGVTSSISFGFPRDTFWPKSAAAFGVIGLLATLLAAQLVAPTRRLSIRRPFQRSAVATPVGTTSTDIHPEQEIEEIEEIGPAEGPATEMPTDEP